MTGQSSLFTTIKIEIKSKSIIYFKNTIVAALLAFQLFHVLSATYSVAQNTVGTVKTAHY